MKAARLLYDSRRITAGSNYGRLLNDHRNNVFLLVNDVVKRQPFRKRKVGHVIFNHRVTDFRRAGHFFQRFAVVLR